MKSIQQHRTALMVMNVIVALLCIASIAGYFFIPLFTVRVKLTPSAEDLRTIVGNISVGDVEVVYPDLETMELELSFDTIEFIGPVFSSNPIAETEALIARKADDIAVSVTPTLRSVVTQVAEVTLVETVKTEVSQIATDKAKELIADAIPDISEDEQQAILEEAQINDEYFEMKSEEALELLNSGTADLGAVQDFAADTVEEVYDKLSATDHEELSDLTLSEEDRQQIDEIVEENIGEFTDEEGNLSMDTIVDLILSELASDGEGTASAPAVRALSLEAAAAAAPASAAATDTDEELAATISGYIRDFLIGESSAAIFYYLGLGAIALMAFSMLAWVYLLLKVFIKGFSMNPAVKLKAPIILWGWLPFLILFLIPSAGMLAVDLAGGFGALAGRVAGIPEVVAAVFRSITNISFMTSGLFAFIAAVALIILFIPYNIVKKTLTLELAPRLTPEEEVDYISQNPSLMPQEPIVKEHTVPGDPYLDEELFEADRNGTDKSNEE